MIVDSFFALFFRVVAIWVRQSISVSAWATVGWASGGESCALLRVGWCSGRAVMGCASPSDHWDWASCHCAQPPPPSARLTLRRLTVPPTLPAGTARHGLTTGQAVSALRADPLRWMPLDWTDAVGWVTVPMRRPTALVQSATTQSGTATDEPAHQCSPIELAASLLCAHCLFVRLVRSDWQRQSTTPPHDDFAHCALCALQSNSVAATFVSNRSRAATFPFPFRSSGIGGVARRTHRDGRVRQRGARRLAHRQPRRRTPTVCVAPSDHNHDHDQGHDCDGSGSQRAAITPVASPLSECSGPGPLRAHPAARSVGRSSCRSAVRTGAVGGGGRAHCGRSLSTRRSVHRTPRRRTIPHSARKQSHFTRRRRSAMLLSGRHMYTT